MQRTKLTVIRDFIVKNCKIVFPIVVVAVVAGTVTFALNMNQEKTKQNDAENGKGTTSESNGSEHDFIPWWLQDESSESGDGAASADGTVNVNVADIKVEDIRIEDIPEFVMQPNEDDRVNAIVTSYYNALAEGDLGVLSALFDTISENDLQYYKALSEYLDHYTELQANTKQGLVDGSMVAYVYYRVCFVNHEEEFPGADMFYFCTNDDGELYIKNATGFTEAEEAYITTISDQADVKEFYTRVTVEYDDLTRENPALAAYITEVTNQVNINRGVALADQNQSGGESQAEGKDQPEDGNAAVTPEPETPTTPEYASTTTTVNVRSSDSEKADKLGRVSAGTRVKVKEVGVNGWTKIEYEGGDGYIKSEFLQFAESAAGLQTMGTVTANTNINVRASASQSAEKLGMLSAGESLDLLAIEGDWCKVVFNGQVAYVKAEYVKTN